VGGFSFVPGRLNSERPCLPATIANLSAISDSIESLMGTLGTNVAPISRNLSFHQTRGCTRALVRRLGWYSFRYYD